MAQLIDPKPEDQQESEEFTSIEEIEPDVAGSSRANPRRGSRA